MKRKEYITPDIEWIQLDNEISLALESTPPVNPYETNNVMPTEYNFNNPLNIDFA